ncbi:L-2-hydroxyglutarate oxidase [cyanobacterium endosymbiont of Epithemia clementina EcSB]|uniref:L-2-hydroxyglutarate oxidase n=1 Tax=cyanobacterium endosymbiont of Epithemia clementina EcSB TaxID=3034674 RepID=UPI0024813CEA|nr:L-2-hydroxyglutarate oxidase [cyanobacterium endosymbiont of Epithemia clementina EcSB]WGT66672.1 L-2-hydroxyglutarate oxidase [cyanobacterium endosymbiont of Epithemia clementina EcSB]
MYNFAIIGGGIVGLSTGMALGQKYPNASIVVLEKEDCVAFHQTGRNSGVIHSGIYYKPGSFKAKFTSVGNQSMVDFCRTYDIPHEVCGKVIVATKEKELLLLENIYQLGLEKKLKVKKISSQEVKEIEPYVNCLAGVYVPTSGIVDYKKVSQKYSQLIQKQGGEICLNTEVKRIIKTSDSQILETNQGTIKTNFVINCSGLYSDRVAKLAKVDSQVKIVPFRGEYYELIPEKRYLVKNLVYPVPNPEFPFLGVHFTRMIDGSVHAGPNAVLSLKREGYKKTDFNLKDCAEVMTYPGFWKLAAKHADEGIKEMIRSFSKAAFVHSLQQIIPEVTVSDVIASKSGVRAQALKPDGGLVNDFLIIQDKQALHVCNAPSPAATASLEIGKAIVARIP